MTWPNVIIPLKHHDNDVRGQYRIQCRCYPHQDMVEILENIAGQGDHGVWWTEKEAHRALSQSRNWVWVPHGRIDFDVDLYYSNRMSHMKIFFRDPNHALLFKLTWL